MRPAPRVQCDDCRFAWYGASASDGLRVVGTCPKCSGHLSFLAADAPASAFTINDRLAAVSPAAVLGLPLRWVAR